MCDCTPMAPGRYCGRPGCRDPQDIALENIRRTAEETARRKSEQGHVEQRDGPGDNFGDVVR